MRKNAAPLVLAALASLCALAAPSTSFAQPSASARQEAGRHFRAGVSAYQTGDYSTALGEFQSAYRIAPHHSVRVNIANCFMHIGRPIDALNHFESFIAEATTAGGLAAQQRREVEAQITELRGQVAEVQVRIEPASARDPIITVDGQPANASGVVRMMPGRHTIEVTADGFATARQDFVASAGQRADVPIALRPPAASTATTTTGASATTSTSGTTTTTAATGTVATTTTATTTTTGATGGENTTTSTGPNTSMTTNAGGTGATGASTGGPTLVAGNDIVGPTERRRGLPLPVFIGAAAGTGAVAIAWGVFGGLAMGANGEFNTIARRIEMGTAQPDDVRAGESAASRARTFALVSDVMMGVTIAGAVATTVIAINTQWSAPARNRVVLTPAVHMAGAGIALGGSL
ncbi:MAG: hypothetical protein JNK05_27665 [Myxococcales bacterium]|nr:hypothetical protein [Myxococcales bacterium]